MKMACAKNSSIVASDQRFGETCSDISIALQKCCVTGMISRVEFNGLARVAADGGRLCLFDHKAAAEPKEAEEHPVLQSLRELQPDELTPGEALERLYQLKQQV